MKFFFKIILKYKKKRAFSRRVDCFNFTENTKESNNRASSQRPYVERAYQTNFTDAS